jgi:predicted ATPase/class 3 adenylate cyclase
MTDQLQPALPTGTVTFLFTDIEGSTPLWERDPAAMGAAVARHHAILHAAAEAHSGHVFKVVGDEFQISFELPAQALEAALVAQRALRDEAWGATGPLKVRMGLHTGPAGLVDGVLNTRDYAVSHTLNRVARIRSAGHGGQVLLSLATAELLGGHLPQDTTLRDLGEHTLKGLARPEHIFQVVVPDLAADFPPLVSQSRLRHNLPAQRTAFVGRETELAELERLIADARSRLVTIVGPGGMGKTRLALELAQRLLQAERLSAGVDRTSPFPDGMCFVDLAPLSAADQIIPTLADALDIQLQGDAGDLSGAKNQILSSMRLRRMLLIFDNFEHLLDGVDLLTAILQAAPDVLVLATSRERLQLHEEQVYAIQGLEFPERERPDDTADYTAAQLFLASARRVQTSFELGVDDLTYLARICRLIEGMPLGIELAAGWVDVLSLADIASEIADQVGRGLDFLETEVRDVPQRHRSMRAVIDGSWERLSETEREVFPQLSVFRAGFTRQAAQAVAPTASLRLLARLANKSLLQYDRIENRYTLHEMLRQYAAEKLATRPEGDADVQMRHSAYYCAALQKWETDLKGPRQFQALAEIKADIENLRTAWRWAIDHGHVAHLDQALDGLCLFYDRPFNLRAGQAACGLVIDLLAGDGAALSADGSRLLAKALAWQVFFQGRGGEPNHPLLQQSLDLLNSLALADQDTRREKAFLLRVMGYADDSRFVKDDREHARRLLEGSLSLYRALGDRWEAAHSAMILANIMAAFQAHDETRQMYEQSLASFRALGDQWMVAKTLNELGQLARETGDFDWAQRLYEESLALSQAQGNQGDTTSLVKLWSLAEFQGEVEAAKGYAGQIIALCRETGDQYSLSLGLLSSAQAFTGSGQFTDALEIVEEAKAESQDIQTPIVKTWIASLQTSIYLHVGRYVEARLQAESDLATAPEIDIPWFPATAQEALGCVMLGEKQHAEAQRLLLDCGTARRKLRMREPGSLALLGLAEYGLGNRITARRYLLEALEIVIESRAFIPLMHLMPIIPVLLADEEQDAFKERAVELYALATSRPFVANSRFFEDIAGKSISVAAAALPPDLVEAARERGRALDWWETAEVLLDELRRLGWAGS